MTSVATTPSSAMLPLSTSACAARNARGGSVSCSALVQEESRPRHAELCDCVMPDHFLYFVCSRRSSRFPSSSNAYMSLQCLHATAYTQASPVVLRMVC